MLPVAIVIDSIRTPMQHTPVSAWWRILATGKCIIGVCRVSERDLTKTLDRSRGPQNAPWLNRVRFSADKVARMLGTVDLEDPSMRLQCFYENQFFNLAFV